MEETLETTAMADMEVITALTADPGKVNMAATKMTTGMAPTRADLTGILTRTA